MSLRIDHVYYTMPSRSTVIVVVLSCFPAFADSSSSKACLCPKSHRSRGYAGRGGSSRRHRRSL